MKLIICLVVLAVYFQASFPLKVSFLYETLCPYCVRFITKQLHPNYKLFQDLIDLELIPYGNTMEQNGKFICQHGPEECTGNKVHGCVINSNSIETSEAYVACTENADPEVFTKNLKTCADENQISWSDIQKCLASGEADKIMKKNENKTNKVVFPDHMRFVPALLFNEALLNFTDLDHAMRDFKGLLCKYLGNKSPKCNNNL